MATSSGQESKDVKHRRLTLILSISGFLDLFGVSMILPLMVPQIRELGASPTLAGIIGSSYGSLQLFSSPIVGKYSDNISRQLSLFMCLILSACGYTIIGLYSSLLVFFLGRIVLGCFKHSQTISKAYLASILDDCERASVLGTFNSCSSIGFIVGPVIGGHIAESKWGFSLVAFVSGFVFLINAVLIWRCVSDISKMDEANSQPTKSLSRDDTSISLQKLGSDEINFSLSSFIKSFGQFDWPNLWDLFLVKFLCGFSVIIFRTNFTMVLKQKFHASPSTIGYMTSYSGIVATLSGFVIGKITRRYNNDAKLFLHMALVTGITLLFLTLSSSVFMLVVALTPFGISTSVARVTGATLTVGRTGNKNVGSIMGLSQSVMALARMIAPFIAGLAQEISVDGASYVSTVACFISVIVMIIRPQYPKLKKQ